MTEHRDALEAELAALRPHQMSPVLREAVAARLAASPPVRRRWPRRLALAGGMLAAAVLAAILLTRTDRPPEGERAENNPPHSSAPVTDLASDDAWPTVLVYSRALGAGSDEMEKLLDEHARLGSHPDPHDARVIAFTRSDDELHPLTGEL